MSLIFYLSVEQRETCLFLFSLQTFSLSILTFIYIGGTQLYFWHLIKLLRLLVAYYYWFFLKAQ